MTNNNLSSWENCHLYKIREQRKPVTLNNLETNKLRSEIEPWLTALFQSEHLSLLLGGGISSAIHQLAKNNEVGAGMAPIQFSVFQRQIETAAKKSAEKSGRGEPNIEDQIRVSNELIKGLGIYISDDVDDPKKIEKHLKKFKEELEVGLAKFANQVLQCEYNIIHSASSEQAAKYLMNFLISFASRSATRERLNIFTTNYDRIVEYGSELAGIRLIDRFVGTVNSVFRSSRVNVDMHYNPPGIRGEPRYLEGVVHFSKLMVHWIGALRTVLFVDMLCQRCKERYFLDEGCKNLLIYPN